MVTSPCTFLRSTGGIVESEMSVNAYKDGIKAANESDKFNYDTPSLILR